MKKKWIAKIAVCIIGCAAISYEHIHELNKLTAMRIQIPQIAQEIALVNEEIDRLDFEFQSIENPVHLLYLAKNAEYSDLKYPLQEDILVVNTAQPTVLAKIESKPNVFEMHPFKLSVILGAH